MAAEEYSACWFKYLKNQSCEPCPVPSTSIWTQLSQATRDGCSWQHHFRHKGEQRFLPWDFIISPCSGPHYHIQKLAPGWRVIIRAQWTSIEDLIAHWVSACETRKSQYMQGTSYIRVIWRPAINSRTISDMNCNGSRAVLHTLKPHVWTWTDYVHLARSRFSP